MTIIYLACNHQDYVPWENPEINEPIQAFLDKRECESFLIELEKTSLLDGIKDCERRIIENPKEHENYYKTLIYEAHQKIIELDENRIYPSYYSIIEIPMKDNNANQ